MTPCSWCGAPSDGHSELTCRNILHGRVYELEREQARLKAALAVEGDKVSRLAMALAKAPIRLPHQGLWEGGL